MVWDNARTVAAWLLLLNLSRLLSTWTCGQDQLLKVLIFDVGAVAGRSLAALKAWYFSFWALSVSSWGVAWRQKGTSDSLVIGEMQFPHLTGHMSHQTMLPEIDETAHSYHPKAIGHARVRRKDYSYLRLSERTQFSFGFLCTALLYQSIQFLLPFRIILSSFGSIRKP